MLQMFQNLIGEIIFRLSKLMRWINAFKYHVIFNLGVINQKKNAFSASTTTFPNCFNFFYTFALSAQFPTRYTTSQHSATVPSSSTSSGKCIFDMHVFMEGFVKSFEEIRTSSLSHATCKLVMFVSCLDIDALCATKLIASLLKADLIPHKIVPVMGFEDLRKSYSETVADDDEIKNVLLIGCGATIDLLDFLSINEEEQLNSKKLYVIDNHRPWNLDNLFGSRNVVCFLDGFADLDNLNGLQDSYANYLRLMEEEEENEIRSDESDEDNETNDDEEGDEEKDQEKNDDAPTDDDEAEPAHNGEKRSREGSPSNGSNGATKKRRLKLLTRTEEIEKYKTTLEKYYNQGSSLATSTTSLIYSLVSDLQTPTITHLWLTVVAATSLDAQHPHLYRLLFPTLRTEVFRLNPNAVAPDLMGTGSNGTSNGMPNHTGEDTSLYIETDYPFYLLRHWTLYDSMSHSSYISAKLRLYTEEGRRRLHKVLAKMGISLQDARERWTHMNLSVKKVLPEKLGGVSAVYGIEGVIRQGIVRRYGYKGSISAGDTVDALLTLLQTGQRLQIEGGPGAITEEDFHIGNNFMNGENKDPRDRFWIENFWTAWDALDDVNKMIKGIQLAKTLQKCIVASATALLERRLIKDLRRFRLAVLKDGPDLEIFSNPLALAQLAVWIAEASAEVSPRSLPLVVASLYPPTNSYLVVGIGPRKLRRRQEKKKKKKAAAEEAEDDKEEEEEDENEDEADELVQYNEFGSAFHQIAEEIHAKVKVDAFESSVIEVAKDDLSRFLEALTLIGIKY